MVRLNPILDPHVQPVPDDTDNDLLKDSEEARIGYDSLNGDQNQNEILDGVDLARNIALKIDGLPLYFPPDNGSGTTPTVTYKERVLFMDWDDCEICDIWNVSIQAGYWIITNPDWGMSMNVPFVAHHSMRHGSFSYNGTKSDGRVDIVTLSRILGVAPSAVKDTRWQVYR